MRVSNDPSYKNPNYDNYGKDVLDLAYDFSRRLHEELGDLVKCIVLFGSSARKTVGKKGDIDLLVVVDDLQIFFDKSVSDMYGVVIKRLVSSISFRLHVTSLKLTDFWDYVRAGDPVAINVLRDGVALLDTGFFDPLRALLVKGRIRPSKEAIWSYFARAPRNLFFAKSAILKSCVDLYWAVIDSAHAALMQNGVSPPSPEMASEMLDKHLVSAGKLEKKYVKIMKDFYSLHKRISYREVKEVSGKEFDVYFSKAEDFVDRMEKFVNKK